MTPNLLGLTATLMEKEARGNKGLSSGPSQGQPALADKPITTRAGR